MRFLRRIAAAAVLTGSLVLGCTTAGGLALVAAEIEDDAADASYDRDALTAQQEETSSEADELLRARESLQESLDHMDLELYDLSEEINSLSGEIEQTQSDIEDAKAALLQAESDAETQYENMKLRIRYLYENGGTLSWTSIFSAKSFADALNRVEYAIDLASADRRLLEEYKETLAAVDAEKKALEEKQEELLAQQEALTEKKTALLASIETAQTDMEDTDAALAKKEQELAEITDEIAAMEEYERLLNEQKAKEAAEEQARLAAEAEAKRKAEEEEARKKAEEEAAAASSAEESSGTSAGDDAESDTSAGGDTESGSSSGADSESGGTAAGDDPLRYYLHTTTPVAVSEEEEALFAALIYCEAGGESYETQLAVASVVVNRINSSRYPDNLIDVIYEKNQFTPASSGRLAVVLEKNLATDSCRTAAKEALAGNICGDWLNFCYNFGTIDGLVIGTEVFYEL